MTQIYHYYRQHLLYYQLYVEWTLAYHLSLIASVTIIIINIKSCLTTQTTTLSFAYINTQISTFWHNNNNNMYDKYAWIRHHHRCVSLYNTFSLLTPNANIVVVNIIINSCKTYRFSLLWHGFDLLFSMILLLFLVLQIYTLSSSLFEESVNLYVSW